MSRNRLPSMDTADKHAADLQRFLDEKKAKGEPLPRRGAALNASAIARALGINRQVLYQNPKCEVLLEEYDRADQERFLSKLDQATIARENKDKVDKERSELEADNLALRAKIASMATELERLRRLETLMTETGKLP